MNRGKRSITVAWCCAALLLLPGCWNYRSLNDMVIVSGIAVDRNSQNGNYHLSFEIIDLTTPVKEKGLSALIIESEGKTLFDAARNAKRRSADKLYFGNTQVIVVSEKIAKEEGVGGIIDWFLRDSECRETLCFAVSQEKTAREILSIYGINNAIVAYDIHEIITDDNAVTSSADRVELYKIFNILHAGGKSLSLPALHNVENDGELVTELNGMAVFKEDKLAGYLSAEESKYFLFADDEIKGGVLTLSSDGGKEDISLEISRNKTQKAYSYDGDKLKITIKTATRVFLNEAQKEVDPLDEKQMTDIAKKASKKLENSIQSIIKHVQAEYGSDIFGFGSLIHQKDPKLWKELSSDWERIFPALEVEVNAKIAISNTAYVK